MRPICSDIRRVGFALSAIRLIILERVLYHLTRIHSSFWVIFILVVQLRVRWGDADKSWIIRHLYLDRREGGCCYSNGKSEQVHRNGQGRVSG